MSGFFFLAAFVLTFLTGIGVQAIPNIMIWAQASAFLGFVLWGVPGPWPWHRP